MISIFELIFIKRFFSNNHLIRVKFRSERTTIFFLDIHNKNDLLFLYDLRGISLIFFILFLYFLNNVFSKFVKLTNLLILKGYISENIKIIMNLKERGITVGDLIIIIIIILTTTVLVKTFNNNKKTTTLNTSGMDSYLLSNNHFNNLTT